MLEVYSTHIFSTPADFLIGPITKFCLRQHGELLSFISAQGYGKADATEEEVVKACGDRRQ